MVYILVARCIQQLHCFDSSDVISVALERQNAEFLVVVALETKVVLSMTECLYKAKNILLRTTYFLDLKGINSFITRCTICCDPVKPKLFPLWNMFVSTVLHDIMNNTVEPR